MPSDTFLLGLETKILEHSPSGRVHLQAALVQNIFHSPSPPGRSHICMFLNQEFATQLFGDFKMVKIVSHWLVDSEDHFQVESRKLGLF